MTSLDDQFSDFEDDREPTPSEIWAQDSSKRFLDELFDNVVTYRTGTAYNGLMEFVAKFRFYSPFNAMLVHVQKPGTTYVLPAHKWKKEFHRTIKPNAQPMVILQPFGPVMFVFDVSETEGKLLPPEIENPFGVRSGIVGSQLDKTITNVKRDGVRVSEVAHGSQRAGSIGPTSTSGITLQLDHNTTVELRYDLLLNSNHNATVRYATLTHELGHLYCGHLGTPNEKWWPDRRGLPLEVREFEAESVAYLVCRRAGIEPPSDEYLSGYLQRDKEVPSISLERVLTSAGLIEQMGRNKMPFRKKKQS